VYKKILIATDGSELATRAVHDGLALAKVLDASVVVVTVTEPWPALAMTNEAGLMTVNPVAEYEKAAEESARAILDGTAAMAKKAGLAVTLLNPTSASPAEGIVETAESQGSDLIVMASHGRRGLGRLVLGSQASDVLVKSRIPVLVIRGPTGKEEAATVPPMPLT
jgi:nucleotide-binding universal stress UspA family protein